MSVENCTIVFISVLCMFRWKLCEGFKASSVPNSSKVVKATVPGVTRVASPGFTSYPTTVYFPCFCFPAFQINEMQKNLFMWSPFVSKSRWLALAGNLIQVCSVVCIASSFSPKLQLFKPLLFSIPFMTAAHC